MFFRLITILYIVVWSILSRKGTRGRRGYIIEAMFPVTIGCPPRICFPRFRDETGHGLSSI